jgi:hypothetical protein
MSPLLKLYILAFLRSLKSLEMQHEDFSIALLGRQGLLCLLNKDKVTLPI